MVNNTNLPFRNFDSGKNVVDPLNIKTPESIKPETKSQDTNENNSLLLRKWSVFMGTMLSILPYPVFKTSEKIISFVFSSIAPQIFDESTYARWERQRKSFCFLGASFCFLATLGDGLSLKHRLTFGSFGVLSLALMYPNFFINENDSVHIGSAANSIHK